MKYDLSNPAVIRSVLDRHGFHFSKALGQNFLINPSVCPRMAQLGGDEGAAGVIEVGPGIGVLTAELSRHFKKVVAIELDTRLIPVLSETLEGAENVRVLQGDVLTADLPGIIREEFGGEEVCVCANLPYYITSPVIMHLLESRLPLRCVTVMVQKEVASRLTARPGSREAGAVTLAVHYYTEPKVLFHVSAGSFMPPPKVDSAVIRLDIRKEPAVRVSDEARMFRVIKSAFGQRRKTLLNALSSGLQLPKDLISAAMQQTGLSPDVRGERLTLAEFAALSDALGALPA